MRNNLLLIPAAMLLIAILPLPYGFYTFLRLVVTISAVVVAWKEYSNGNGVGPWVILFGAIALLFNPLIPVHSDRSVWFFLDIGAALLFGAKWLTEKKATT